LGPIVVAILVCGVAARLLIGSAPTPIEAPPLAETEPTAEIAQAVPLPIEAVQQPAAPPPDPRLLASQRLREAVFAPFRGLAGRFGIAVKDLGSGQSVFLNETFRFQAASLFKLPVMYEVFKLREWGFLTFREQLTIGPEDAAMDLGSLTWPVGTKITLGTALERMITISDNSSAFMLARRVGAWRINEDAVGLGLEQTRVRGDDLSTSPLDMLRLLELIARGQAVDPDSSAEMVHLMARQQVRDRIPAFMPPEATVANKTGNWERATHDVAIVYGPRATFVIALLSDNVIDEQDVYGAMARAARNVYDLVDDPEFETAPEPPLPRATIDSYASAPRLPVAAARGAEAGNARSAPVPTSSTRPAVQGAPTGPATAPSRAPAPPTAGPTRNSGTSPPVAPAVAPSAPVSRPTSPAAPAAAPTATPPPPAPTATPARSASKPTRTPKPEATPSGRLATPVSGGNTSGPAPAPDKDKPR
jgi:beta-lactamase class A